jgi:hypothetical protein
MTSTPIFCQIKRSSTIAFEHKGDAARELLGRKDVGAGLHAREIDRACSPLVAAPALPAASRRVPHSFASGLLQSRVRPPPRPQLDPTESRRYLGGRPWTRRNLGGIWAAALPPPPRLFGSSRCAPPTEPQCVPCAPCRRNGVPLPTRLPRMYPNEAVRTPAWRMPY